MSETFADRTRRVIDMLPAKRQRTLEIVLQAGLENELDPQDALYIAFCYNNDNPVNFGGLREYESYKWMRRRGLAN